MHNTWLKELKKTENLRGYRIKEDIECLPMIINIMEKVINITATSQ